MIFWGLYNINIELKLKK